jgi:two-component system KDP operon response regulator KdpE
VSDEGPLIVLIEDDPSIRRFLDISLTAHSYRVRSARLGAEGIALCAEEGPSLVILDLGLPDLDGQGVLLRLREWSAVPVIVLSVRSDERDKVTALDNGANDYVTKPFGISELLARIRVLLRDHHAGTAELAEICTDGLRVDLANRRVWLDDREIRLARKEYDLLRLFVQNPGRVLTHQQILDTLWEPGRGSGMQHLRVLVGNLRQKLGDEATSPRFILTEPGVGYRLIAV